METTFLIDNLWGVRVKTNRWPMSSFEYSYNFNLNNGEIFEFKDLFRSWKFNDLATLMENKIINSDLKCVDQNIIFDLNLNRPFYLTENSIKIIFKKYEVACGAAGPITIELTYDEIRDYINPNGLLGYIKS